MNGEFSIVETCRWPARATWAVSATASSTASTRLSESRGRDARPRRHTLLSSLTMTAATAAVATMPSASVPRAGASDRLRYLLIPSSSAPSARTNLAGTPITSDCGATSRVTTAPATTNAFADLDPGKQHGSRPPRGSRGAEDRPRNR